jgi:hypothetical protein
MTSPQYSKLEERSGSQMKDTNLDMPPRRPYDMCMVFRYKTSKAVKF